MTGTEIGTNYFAEFTPEVNLCLTNELGFVVLADCYGNPNVVATQAGIYNTGCKMIRNDVLSGDNIYWNQGTIASPSWVQSGGGGGGDNKVKVDADDTTAGFLIDKLAAGTGISLMVVNVGGDERVGIIASFPTDMITGSIDMDQVAFGTGPNTIGGADFSINYDLSNLLFTVYDDVANIALQVDGINHVAQIGGFNNNTSAIYDDTAQTNTVFAGSSVFMQDGLNEILKWSVGHDDYFKLDVLSGLYIFGPALAGNGTALTVDDTNLRSYFQNKAGFSKGADVASATTISLGDDGNYFQISGTTNISTISSGTWRDGMKIALYFKGALSIAHNTGGNTGKIPFLLASSATALTVAGARFEFVLDMSIGSFGSWVELSRTYP